MAKTLYTTPLECLPHQLQPSKYAKGARVEEQEAAGRSAGGGDRQEEATAQRHQHHLDRVWSLFDSSQDQLDRHELEFSERDRSRVDREKIKKPETPPLPRKETAKPEDFGMRTSRELKNARDKFQSKIEKALKKINEEHELYFTNLEFSWDQISRPYWNQDLNDRHKMFVRGAAFVDDEDEPTLKKCAGMAYDTDKKDYYILYHDYDKSPKRTDDEDVDFSYFNEQRAYRRRNDYIEGINDWKYLKFLEPKQVEEFKRARDKKQYLFDKPMCPKAIYTLDLTLDVGVDG